MKVLLKPYPQKELGIILFRPAPDALQLFSGKRLLITDEPADLQSAPDGLITGAHQKVLDNPVISNFLSSDLVIRRMLGGWEGLTRWVKQNRGCQCDDPGYHHHEMTHARRERGVVALCWHHDTQYRDKASAQLDAAALANTLEYVSERIRYWLGEREGHQITVAEICWFAVARGFVDKLPRVILYDIFGIRSQEHFGQTKESDTNPFERKPEDIIAEGLKPVLALAIDPETPESYALIPKRRRYENSKYTQWVKRQPCCACGNGSDDPHHITGNGFGGMATKAHDLFVIPLCRRCHDSLHANTQAWEEEHGDQMYLVMKTLDRALATGVIATGKAK
ncbi:DUF968 domain-containing protein [Rahnella sp. PD12R]|uniref:DUF968 domain-containing protein n=1 Tax=Rahnella sp. PD12R TaxID=2855688 RepID=UPI001C47A2E5|nr:DUF968 domain-containing protein [Rahnella sp. PD12R]MBV6817766.1 DUF968 domain-containing protein [Rahnella sp. PD12R]